MNLSQAKINKLCEITSVQVEDFATQIRLMELGLTFGTKIKLVRKSCLKKTLLVVFVNSCFTLKENLASKIEVRYV